MNKFKRIREWFVWFGGWEKANGKGWRFYLNSTRQGKPHRIWLGPTPVSLFGHHITFFTWGFQVALRHDYLVIVWRPYRACYFSPNGTPWAATRRFWGRDYIFERE